MANLEGLNNLLERFAPLINPPNEHSDIIIITLSQEDLRLLVNYQEKYQHLPNQSGALLIWWDYFQKKFEIPYKTSVRFTQQLIQSGIINQNGVVTESGIDNLPGDLELRFNINEQ